MKSVPCIFFGLCHAISSSNSIGLGDCLSLLSAANSICRARSLLRPRSSLGGDIRDSMREKARFFAVLPSESPKKCLKLAAFWPVDANFCQFFFRF